MSLCRLSDTNQVYIITARDGFECVWCRLTEGAKSFIIGPADGYPPPSEQYEVVWEHVKRHRDAGHLVDVSRKDFEEWRDGELSDA